MRLVDPETGQPYVEKRRRRSNLCGEPRELTFSCYRQYSFLGSDRTRGWFREAVEDARRRCSVQVWAYVVMPDHVHLLIAPVARPEAARGVTQAAPETILADPVSPFLQAIKEPVARHALAYLRAHAPEWLTRVRVREGNRVRYRFWQPGGGYDRNVHDPSTLRSMIEYIHANPVRRGLVTTAEDWEWSSARWFAGIRPAWIEMDAAVIDFLTIR